MSATLNSSHTTPLSNEAKLALKNSLDFFQGYVIGNTNRILSSDPYKNIEYIIDDLKEDLLSSESNLTQTITDSLKSENEKGEFEEFTRWELTYDLLKKSIKTAIIKSLQKYYNYLLSKRNTIVEDINRFPKLLQLNDEWEDERDWTYWIKKWHRLETLYEDASQASGLALQDDLPSNRIMKSVQEYLRGEALDALFNQKNFPIE